MSTQTPMPTRPDWTETLDAQRQNVSYVLIGVAGALVLAAAILMWKYGWDSAALIVSFLLFGLTALGCGLGFLVGINILGYFYLPKSSDWTEAGIYTLSSKSENVLKGLKQPVKVYVMEQQRGERFDVDMRDLMENARAVSDKIQAEYLIRD